MYHCLSLPYLYNIYSKFTFILWTDFLFIIFHVHWLAPLIKFHIISAPIRIDWFFFYSLHCFSLLIMKKSINFDVMFSTPDIIGSYRFIKTFFNGIGDGGFVIKRNYIWKKRKIEVNHIKSIVTADLNLMSVGILLDVQFIFWKFDIWSKSCCFKNDQISTNSLVKLQHLHD